MTEHEYLEFCKNAESMKVYDGRGTFDLYECVNSQRKKGCGYYLITTYADKGVTPFTIPCPRCGSYMNHTKTSKTEPKGYPIVKWVRPTYEQYVNLSPGMKHHVEQGGLIRETEL